MPWVDWPAFGQGVMVAVVVTVGVLIFASWMWDLGDDS